MKKDRGVICLSRFKHASWCFSVKPQSRSSPNSAIRAWITCEHQTSCSCGECYRKRQESRWTASRTPRETLALSRSLILNKNSRSRKKKCVPCVAFGWDAVEFTGMEWSRDGGINRERWVEKQKEPPVATPSLPLARFMGLPNSLTVCFKFGRADVSLGDWLL